MAEINSMPIAIAGIGKIARDQHIPSIERSSAFTLAASVSRNASVDGIAHYPDIDSFLAAEPGIPAVALCVPPQVRFNMAWSALQTGRHVLLEKPPGATLSEVEALRELAGSRNLTLFATWHSRFAPAVAPAKAWLAGQAITRVEIVWKEDVRRWHPGQAWIWEAGGVGVFDPGINALSIVTEILPHAIHLTAAQLVFPDNRETPIAARLRFTDHLGADISADIDWRQTGPQSWNIVVETTDGTLRLSSGGAELEIDDVAHPVSAEAEYDGIYNRFAELIAKRQSEVDVRPLVHVADAFMLGKRIVTDPFHD